MHALLSYINAYLYTSMHTYICTGYEDKHSCVAYQKYICACANERCASIHTHASMYLCMCEFIQYAWNNVRANTYGARSWRK